MKDQDLLSDGHVFVGYTLEGKTVRLDGNEFEECQFVNCQLVYAGTGPLAVQRSTFTGCSFSLDYPALRGAEFLSFMSLIGNGGEQLVDQFVACLKRGVVPGPEERRPFGVTLQ